MTAPGSVFINQFQGMLSDPLHLVFQGLVTIAQNVHVGIGLEDQDITLSINMAVDAVVFQL